MFIVRYRVIHLHILQKTIYFYYIFIIEIGIKVDVVTVGLGLLTLLFKEVYIIYNSCMMFLQILKIRVLQKIYNLN